MKEQLKGSFMLLFATVIWGSAFVAQSVGMDHIGPFTFQACRCALAVCAMFPVICIMDISKKDGKTFLARWTQPGLWKAGLLCGVALFAATGLQQVGLVYTEPGKAGFITAMYIVIVPLLGLFFKRKVGLHIWISVIMAVGGLYMLSAVGVSRINIGDIYMILCAVAFAVQITIVDRMGGALDGVRLNFIQFFVNATLSATMMFLLETPHIADIRACTIPIVYTGLFSSCIAYSLQILGQQKLNPDRASLIMSLESVFALITGWLILDQRLSVPESIGSLLVFSAVLLSQIPEKQRKTAA